MKKLSLSFVLLAILSSVIYLYADPVSQIVGTAAIDPSTTTPTWRWNSNFPINNTASISTPAGVGLARSSGTAGAPFMFGGLHARNGAHSSFNHLHTADQSQPWAASETLSVVSGMYNPGTLDYSPITAAGGIGDGNGGILGAGSFIQNGSADTGLGGTGWARQRSASAINLTQTTSLGIPLQASYSTWSCTNAPAAATRATCSQAAGGGTVRHVVTSFSFCTYTSTAATVPVAQPAVVRDGATGAGTVIYNGSAGSGTVQGSDCHSSPPGYTKIGTANTAMTVEFGAAPPANVLQSVNMTGYSVP